MTNTFNTQKKTLATVGVFAAFMFISFFGANQAHAAITTQLGLGSTGAQVTQLQQFLASNPLIYPSQKVTGYFGALTQAAVVQFQLNYDIPSVGHVGPMTMGKINDIMASGLGLDINAPVMGNTAIQTGSTNATVNFATNELARGQVFYATTPLQANEAVLMHGEQPFVSGTLASNANLQTTQAITLPNLQLNTTYYYLTRAIDNSGNVSMSIPNSFHTNQY